jgi:transcriptional regulator with XRE-family HTH domain
MDNYLQQMEMRIAARRKELGFTQEELADMVNVSVQTISTAERGRKALRPENIVKICKALRCTTDYILIGKSMNAIPETLNRTYKDLTPLQYRCLTQIVESYLMALSSDQN